MNWSRSCALSALIPLAAACGPQAADIATDHTSSAPLLSPTTLVKKPVFRPGRMGQAEVNYVRIASQVLQTTLLGPDGPAFQQLLVNSIQGALYDGRLVAVSPVRIFVGVPLGTALNVPSVRDTLLENPSYRTALAGVHGLMEDTGLGVDLADDDVLGYDWMREQYEAMHERVAEQLDILVNVELTDAMLNQMAYADASHDKIMAMIMSNINRGWGAVAALAAVGLGAWYASTHDVGAEAEAAIDTINEVLGGINGGGCTIRIPPANDVSVFVNQLVFAARATQSTEVLVTTAVQGKLFSTMRFVK